MSNELTISSILFSQPGSDNSDTALAAGFKRARELNIKSALIATTSGNTAIKAASLNPDFKIVAVTHSTGFKEPDRQELTQENRQKLEKAGRKYSPASMHWAVSTGLYGANLRPTSWTRLLHQFCAYRARVLRLFVKFP